MADKNIAAELPATRTARGKLWRLPDFETPDDELLSMVDNNMILARLLQRRGIKQAKQAVAFLDPKAYEPTSPMTLPDMDKAVVRINQAIELKEHITIYGDYDVDGVTATSVLLTVLKELGASVDFYIPNRIQEGYSLNLKAVSILASKHRTKLIITCDCGVSNFAEINFANSLGVDTLILDHHNLPELMPPAYGIVHPKLLSPSHPLYHLPGVGVAYKVCEAILIDRGLSEKTSDLLDYVTLGMIADLVPLVAENRYLVQIGLPRLINSKRPGISALLAQVKKSDDTDLVGFGLAPRINAVGRLAEAKTAVELLTTDDVEKAKNLAAQLNADNARRQEICERVFFEAEQVINAQVDLSKDKAIAIYKEGWHHGVVGIVASRLVEKYGRPVFIAELEKEQGVVKGSARSIEAIDLYSVLKANEQLLSKWGGHKMAAGFSVPAEKADILCRALVNTCNQLLNGKELTSSLDIDLQVEEPDVSLELTRLLYKLAPFGMENKKPLLCLKGLICQASRRIGKEAKHHRLELKDPNSKNILEGLIWNSHGKAPGEGQVVDIVFTPEINSFNGRQRLQLVLSDWRQSLNGKDHCVPESNNHSEVPAVFPDLAKSAKASEPVNTPKLRQIVWKDVRQHSDHSAIVTRGTDKFGDQIAIFAEGVSNNAKLNLLDRLSLTPKPHLLILQFPPTLKIFQEIISLSQADTIYLLGSHSLKSADASNFLKQLLGLIRFTISKKEGKVAGEKLACAMATTKMAIALGLTMLKKLTVIDWYAEDGDIYLDLIGAPIGSVEDMAEFRQLAETLAQIDTFRKWCATAKLKEVQLAIVPNNFAKQLISTQSMAAITPPTESVDLLA